MVVTFLVDLFAIFLDNSLVKDSYSERKMELRRNEEVIKPSSGDFISRQTTHAISSLNEAWCHILDEYAVDTPLDRIILPIMRDCFFGGAVYALFLLQKGHGDQVVSDIAGFTTKEPRS